MVLVGQIALLALHERQEDSGLTPIKSKKALEPELKLEEVSEGAARLMVPVGSRDDPFHKLAFFNPAMGLNRTISARIMRTCLTESQRKDGLLIDGLCATGARGIRYALESGFGNIEFVDANPHAITVLRKNIALNKLAKKSKVSEMDFTRALYSNEEKSRAIEVDAFGTPAPFVQASLWKSADGGIISLTATDFAALAGARPLSCLRHYDAKPLHCSQGHEIGLRIILGRLARTAAMLDKAVEPVACFYFQHSGKVMGRAIESARASDAMIEEKMGYAWECKICLQTGAVKAGEWEKGGRECTACNAQVRWAGPLWIGTLCDPLVIQGAIELIGHDSLAPEHAINALKLLKPLLEENSLPPMFYDIHEICGKLRCQAPSSQKLIENLGASGFKATRTHFTPTGIRTDAPARALLKAIKTTPAR